MKYLIIIGMNLLIIVGFIILVAIDFSLNAHELKT